MSKHRADLPGEVALRDCYANMKARNIERYRPFEKPFCQEFYDIFDGFVIHTEACSRYQDSSVSGTGCIDLTTVRPWPAGLSAVR